MRQCVRPTLEHDTHRHDRTTCGLRIVVVTGAIKQLEAKRLPGALLDGLPLPAQKTAEMLVPCIAPAGSEAADQQRETYLPVGAVLCDFLHHR